MASSAAAVVEVLGRARRRRASTAPSSPASTTSCVSRSAGLLAAVGADGALGPQPVGPGQHRLRGLNSQHRSPGLGPQGGLRHGQDGRRAAAARRARARFGCRAGRSRPAASWSTTGRSPAGPARRTAGRSARSTATPAATGSAAPRARRPGARPRRSRGWPGPAPWRPADPPSTAICTSRPCTMARPGGEDEGEHVGGDVERQVVVDGGHPQHDAALDRRRQAAPEAAALVGRHDEVHADRPAVAGERGEQVEPLLARWRVVGLPRSGQPVDEHEDPGLVRARPASRR